MNQIEAIKFAILIEIICTFLIMLITLNIIFDKESD